MTTTDDRAVLAPIPLVDLQVQVREIAAEVEQGFARVIGSGGFVGGAEVTRFEESYAEFVGVDHCVGVANGTDGLELALRALDIGPGDEVVMPANTFCATAEAVARAGATAVFVDSDPATYLIDVDAALDRVGARTRAVVPVHLYGQSAATELLQEALADNPRVAVLEDAAQSQGAQRLGRPVGSVGDIASTSFYPGKNLGAYGDAGAVMTSSAELARRVRLLGNHGSDTKYVHETLGFNSRLDGLQAVVLNAKLAHLAAWNAQRAAAADIYLDLLAEVPDVVAPVTLDGNVHVWHLFVVRVAAGERDRVVTELQDAGVGASIHYPVPVHLQPAFSAGYRRGSFPVAEQTAQEILSLPLFPGITREQQVRVVEALSRALQDGGRRSRSIA
jgi:dTDP-4-amino-4,6-dideoxygalactose transaminase